MKFHGTFVALIGLVASVGAANATTINDSSLVDPPGVYFGNGNTNGHFSVTTDQNIEIGQRAVHRYADQITPVGNVYTVPVGPTKVSGKTGADWGFTFSVNTNVDGTGAGGWTLANTISTLSMTDANTGSFGSFDLGLIPDNYLGSAFSFQNSEALSFAAIAAALGDVNYNEFAPDIYTFTLTVSDLAGNALASNQIVVNAVPEPVTISLFGAGLVGAAAMRRRKKAKQA